MSNNSKYAPRAGRLFKRQASAIRISAASLLLSLSCGTEETGPERVAALELDLTSLEVMVNEVVWVHAVARSAAGAALTRRVVTWASGDPEIATVSPLGAVTGVSVGQATLMATSEGATAEVQVTVIPAVGEVEITVAKIGHAADPESFRFLLDGEPLDDPFETFGQRLLVLPVGMYTASLVDLDNRCELLGDSSRVLFVYPRHRQAFMFQIACLLPGQLVVKTQTIGQRSVSDPYRVSLDGGAGLSIDSNGELRFDLHPRTYRVALSTLDARCLAATEFQDAGVFESITVTIQFQVRCYPDPPALSGEKLLVSYNVTSGSGLYAIDPDGARRFNVDQDPLGAGDAALSADGRRLAFRRNGAGSSTLVLLDVATGTKSIFNVGLPISGLSWAPDGQRLVAGLSNDGATSLVVLRADGTVERSLGLTEASSISAHWAPDGRTIAFTRNNHSVMLVNPDGSNVRVLTSSTHDYFDGGRWSADGRSLLIRSYKQSCYYWSYCYPFDARLIVLDAATGKETRTIAIPEEAYGFVWGGTTEEVYFIQAGDVFHSRLDVFGPVNVTRSSENEWSVLWGRFEDGTSTAVGKPRSHVTNRK